MLKSGVYLMSYKDSGSLWAERKHAIMQSRKGPGPLDLDCVRGCYLCFAGM